MEAVFSYYAANTQERSAYAEVGVHGVWICL